MSFIQASSLTPLTSQRIHLWCADLTGPDFKSEEYRPLLTADELDRANRYMKPADQDRFTIQRGLLRCLLARYLDCRPQEIRFQYGARGQPALDDDKKRYGMQFNVSHSGDLVLFAIGKNRDIGVDVERIRNNLDTQSIANRYFTNNEKSYLAEISTDQKYVTFFKIWVCKEAYLKARGTGLSVSLDSFETLPGTRNEILMSPLPQENPTKGWKICILSPSPNYVAALAASGDDWDWTGFRLMPKMLQK